MNPLPGPVITPDGPTSFCIGDSVELTASGFSTYVWSTTETTPSILVNTTGTYTVTVTDLMNCQNSTNISVTVFSLPLVDAGTAVPYCVGDSVQLNASGALNYVWSTDPTLSSTTISNPYSIASANTWYYVQGTDGNNCVNNDSVSVTVNPLPAAPANTFVTSNYTLVTDCSAAVQWYLNGSAIPAPEGIQQIYTLTGNGTYWVTCTDANSCTSLNSDTVVVNGWSIEESNRINNFELFPNPNNGTFTLRFDLLSTEEIELTIMDLSGRILFTEQSVSSAGQFTKTMDLNSLAKGVYLIQLNVADGKITRQLIIQ